MARSKSILTEARQIERAVTLIHLGARLQVLESETDLSYERLLRLYKEVSGRSPSKGQLPFSTDWFMTWQPNIHSSLFLNIHEYLNKVAELDEIDTVIKAYKLYMEQIQAQGMEPLLSVTRAWRLVKHESQLPYPAYGGGPKMYRALWLDGDVNRLIYAPSYRETWTQYDPELAEREILPKEQRRELRTMKVSK